MHRFNVVEENSSFFFRYIRVSSCIEFLENRMYANHAQHPENTLHPSLGHRWLDCLLLFNTLENRTCVDFATNVHSEGPAQALTGC